MAVIFDPDEDRLNIEKHGLSLASFQGFDSSPVTMRDDRLPYGEMRYRAWGMIDGATYCLAYTVRDTDIRLTASAERMRRRCVAMVEHQMPDFDDNPEWTSRDFAVARSAEEVHHPDLAAMLVRPAGPSEEIVLALDADVLAKFQATGPGWQTRINDALRAADPLAPKQAAA